MYIFPGVGVFLDRAKLDPVRRQDVLRLHGKSLDRIAQHLSNAASIAPKEPDTAAEMVTHARKLLEIGPVAHAVAEAMVEEVEKAIGKPVEPAPAKPVKKNVGRHSD